MLDTADRVADELRRTAAERDKANATPRAEIELLRQNDLLQVQEPVEYGGSGLNFAQAAQIIRRIARGDTSIAHLIGYHYAQTRVAGLFGTPAQADAQSRRNASEKLFWGGIQNPRGGSALVLTRDGDGFRLNGYRSFASGASTGDQLSVTAALEGELVFCRLMCAADVRDSPSLTTGTTSGSGSPILAGASYRCPHRTSRGARRGAVHR